MTHFETVNILKMYDEISGSLKKLITKVQWGWDLFATGSYLGGCVAKLKGKREVL